MIDIQRATYQDLKNNFERGAYGIELRAVIVASALSEVDAIRILENLGRMGWRLVKA